MEIPGAHANIQGWAFNLARGGEQLRDDGLGLIAIMNVLRIINCRRLLQGGMTCRWLFGEC